MKLTQEQFNHYLLNEAIKLNAENVALSAALNALTEKIFPDEALRFREILKTQTQRVYEELLVSHPMLQDEGDADLSNWLGQSE